MAEAVDVCVTVVLHKTVTVKVENMENIKTVSEDAVKNDLRHMLENGWYEDEFEAIPE